MFRLKNIVLSSLLMWAVQAILTACFSPAVQVTGKASVTGDHANVNAQVLQLKDAVQNAGIAGAPAPAGDQLMKAVQLILENPSPDLPASSQH